MKDYECPECGNESKKPERCCGKPMKRVWSTNFILKGGGWSRIPDNKSMFEEDKKRKRGEI